MSKILGALTSSSLTKWLGSAFCVIPKLVPSCLTTEITTSLPADAGNLFSTLKHCAPQLLALIWADNEAHSEYMFVLDEEEMSKLSNFPTAINLECSTDVPPGDASQVRSGLMRNNRIVYFNPWL